MQWVNIWRDLVILSASGDLTIFRGFKLLTTCSLPLWGPFSLMPSIALWLSVLKRSRKQQSVLQPILL